MQPDPAIPTSEAAITPPDSADLQDGTACQSPDDELKAKRLSQSPAAAVVGFPPGSGGSVPSSRNREPVPEAPGYRMVRKLGSGTFGEVWLAEEVNTGGQVAIKFLTTALDEQWQLLQAEVAQMAALLDDPGIVQLKDSNLHVVRPYYVMAYAEGGSLAQRVHKGPMPLAEALPLFRRIAEALAYVHAKGICHCDLKPGNVLLDKRGRPRIADFGQAHLANDTTPALGTFFYMAPEQADLSVQEPDTRWDVYGLGALFFAMLTGDPPYGDSTLRHELAKTERLPHRLQVYRDGMERAKPLTAHRQVAGMDRQLAAILERCLAVDPVKRFRSAETVVAALDLRKRRRRQRAILYAGLVVPVLLVLILGGLGWWRASVALEESEKNLEKQAMKSYTNSARLAAAKVKDTVEHYIRDLALAAHNPELKTALRNLTPSDNPRENNAEVNKLLKSFWKDPPLNQNDPVVYWLVFDNQGYCLGARGRSRFEQEYVGQNFAWRGYFTGGADDADAWDQLKAQRQVGQKKDKLPPNWQKKAFEPIKQALYISDPFMSVDNYLSVSLSTPIKDETGTIGVLLVAIELDEIGRWLEDINFEDDGFAVLIDEDPHVLVHKNRPDGWAKSGGVPKVYDKECPLYDDIVNKTNTHSKKGGADVFRDPILNEDYLAGFVAIEFEEPINKRPLSQRWGLLVQVKHAKVIEPATILKTSMIRWGVAMLTVAILMIVGVWLGLLWMLRSEERAALG